MNEIDNMIFKFQSRDKHRFESMLFNYGSTNLTDLRSGRILPAPPRTEYKAPYRKPRPLAKPLKDTHTFTDWKGEVPFDLFIKPKEILRTDPRKIQEYYEKPKDTDHLLAQKTRPRLVMTPAVSMDDIEDPETRKMLCEDIYTTTATEALREAVKPYYRVAAPFPGRPAKANMLTLPKYAPPVVPEEWRMDSVEWDSRQERCLCDPTKEFWLNYPLFECKVCDEMAVVEASRKAKRQMLKH